MFDQLVSQAKMRQIATIYGYYYPTAKNGMVSGLFEEMGFRNVERNGNGDTVWRFDVPEDYVNKNLFIEVNK